MLAHRPFSVLEPGAILEALQEIYAAYPFRYTRKKAAWERNWRAYDQLLFANPDTVGRAGFASFFDGALVGFCSWDPRRAPAVTVGHNGILPPWRGRGFGAAQIRRMLEIFRERGYATATVTTGDEEFFVPAQRTYVSCGFREADRFEEDGDRLIRYELALR